jgi:hypothetical protein
VLRNYEGLGGRAAELGSDRVPWPAGARLTQSLRGTDDFERHPRSTEGTFGGCPQVVRHSLQEFQRDAVLGRELSDCIAQREKRTNSNDVGAKGCKSENVQVRGAERSLKTVPNR